MKQPERRGCIGRIRPFGILVASYGALLKSLHVLVPLWAVAAIVQYVIGVRTSRWLYDCEATVRFLESGTHEESWHYCELVMRIVGSSGATPLNMVFIFWPALIAGLLWQRVLLRGTRPWKWVMIQPWRRTVWVFLGYVLLLLILVEACNLIVQPIVRVLFVVLTFGEVPLPTLAILVYAAVPLAIVVRCALILPAVSDGRTSVFRSAVALANGQGLRILASITLVLIPFFVFKILSMGLYRVASRTTANGWEKIDLWLADVYIVLMPAMWFRFGPFVLNVVEPLAWTILVSTALAMVYRQARPAADEQTQV